jgi:hypothetical protein
MEDAKSGAALWTSRAIEAWRLYTDANLQVALQMTNFAVNTAKEGMSLYAELQTANIEALQECHTYVTNRFRELPEDMKNPREMVQKNVRELSASAEKVSRLLQNNVQATLRSNEQAWLTAKQTSNGIKDTYTQLYDKLTALYQPA